MAESSIPVDVFNPGQVFACLGIVEAAEILLGPTEGGFDWSDPRDARFRVRSRGDAGPVGTVLRFLIETEVRSLAPAGSENRTEKWSVPTERPGDSLIFPFPDPNGPDRLPALLRGNAAEDGSRPKIVLDHWGDATQRDGVKFWAGAGGYPGAGLARDAVNLIRQRLTGGIQSPDWPRAISDPFNLAVEQSSSFRFDWRRDYAALDIGFSVNSHGGITTVGYPLVELLAAIGLTQGRPHRLQQLDYRYGILSAEDGLLDPILLRAALGGVSLPLARRSFRMHLAWPGKEGQARMISTVTEEVVA